MWNPDIYGKTKTILVKERLKLLFSAPSTFATDHPQKIPLGFLLTVLQLTLYILTLNVTTKFITITIGMDHSIRWGRYMWLEIFKNVVCYAENLVFESNVICVCLLWRTLYNSSLIFIKQVVVVAVLFNFHGK